MTRAARHLVLFLAGAASFGLFYAIYRPDDWRFWASMSTAYASLVLLALTLALGPLNRLRSLPNPVTTYLRRDIGIWAGIYGVAHVVFGLQVHMRGKMHLYFVNPDRWYVYRMDPFGIANHSGLAATIVLVLLLALSNDRSLRALGGRRWKSLQRWNYAGAILTVLHGALYMLVEKRSWGLVAVAALIVGIAAALQVAGWRATRRKQAARAR